MLPELVIAQKLLLLALGIPLTSLALMLRKNKNKLATSRLGGIKDMGRLNGTDGLILSRKFMLTFKKSLEGTMVVAPTGEGKTTSIFLPNLLSNSLPKSSLIIGDPKGELFDLTSKYQLSIGRTPLLFEPLGNHAKYNLLENCEGFTEVRELASNLIINGGSGKRGEYFEESGIPCFTSALLNSKNISQAVKFLINTPLNEIINILGNNNNADIKEQFRVFMASAESPKTMSSITSTLLTNLQLWTDHKLINTTSKSDFKPIDLRNKPIALYIKYDTSRSKYLAPFLSVFYTQLIDKIMHNKGLPVLFFLDELQNLGKINNFEETVSMCRSEEVGFLVCMQNISKLFEIYGENNATTILNNLKSKVILPSISDYKTLSYLSNLCGDKQFTGESTTGDKKTYSQVVKKLYTPDEIRRINDEMALLICHNKLPFLDKQNIYYKQSKYYNNVPVELKEKS